MAENKKVMEEEAVDTKETKAEQTCEETKDTKETAAEETKETAAEEKDTKKEEKSEKKGAFGKKKKDKKDEQIEDLNDRLKRQMAEFDNFRKRSEKEKSQMYEIGAKDIIEKILPVVDNFERGLDAVKEEEKEEGGMGETQPPFEGSDFTSELSIVQQELQTQTIWLDQVAMQRGLKNTQEARMWLDKFFGELRIRGDTVKSLHDTKSHFVSWLKIQLDKQKPQKNGKYIPTRISGSDFD